MSMDARLLLSADATTDEIRDIIKRNNDLAHSARGLVAYIEGYQNDPRELWEIPQVKDFASKWVAEGGMTILRVSTMVSTEAGKQVDSGRIGVPGFAALEMWLLSRGEFKSGHAIDQATYDRFVKDLEHSNQLLASRGLV